MVHVGNLFAHRILSYTKFVSRFEKFLPIIVVLSFIIGISISGIPWISNAVYESVDGFIGLYGLVAPVIIFMILAPAFSRVARCRKGQQGNFFGFVLTWMTIGRLLSLIFAVLFTWLVFGLPFYSTSGANTLLEAVKTTGKNLVHMLTTSQYFYAMYLAVVAMFVAKRVRLVERIMLKCLQGVEITGQYLLPLVPLFMVAVGVYVAELGTRLNDQIIEGYDEQIVALEEIQQTPEIEQQIATLLVLKKTAETEPTSLDNLSVLGYRPKFSGEYGMVWAYVLISLVIGVSCFMWDAILLMFTKWKVSTFSIMRFFTRYWIRVYPLLWSTSSEAIAVPLNLYLVKRYYPEVRGKVRQFVIGVGSYLGINGTMICVIVLAGAVASLLGIELSALQLFLAIPVVFLIGFGVPGIPGELLLFGGPLLQVFGFPPKMSAVFLSMYLGLQIGLPDSFRTGTNSTDDCMWAVLMNDSYSRNFQNEDVLVGELLEHPSFKVAFAAKLMDRLALTSAAKHGSLNLN